MDYYTTLHGALAKQCPETSLQWLDQVLESIESVSNPLMEHQIASAMACRKLGDGPFEVKLATGADGSTETNHWQCSDAARVLLALALIRVTDLALPALLSKVYAHGDERERAALLMGLDLLDPDGQWSIEAQDCCRTNSLVLMTAIGMKNPYPAAHFSDIAFNQLVLKSLFMGLNIAHIEGLSGRHNNKLSTMCSGYVDERFAAGRDYPTSIWLAIRLLDCAAETHRHIATCLSSDDVKRRHYAAASLLQQESIPAEIGEKVFQQLETEPDEGVQAILRILTESRRT